MPANKLTSEERILAILLFCYPLLLLTVKGGMNTLFFMLVALSLFTIFKSRRERPQYLDGSAIAFMLVMASGVAAIFLSQLYHGNFSARHYDAASRLLLAIPVYLVLRNANIRTLSWLQYGLPLGAISALLVVLLIPGHYANSDRASTAFLHPIYFGDLALMLGLLSLFSINWLSRDSTSIVTLKTFGCLAGIYVSIISQSRGGWIAIPILLTVWLVMQNKKRGIIKLSYAFPLLLITLLASYFFVDIVQQRIDRIFLDLAAFSNGQADTSVGQRLQLWKAALYLYSNNPVFGVGPEGFANSMTALSQSGFITEEAAQLGRGEVHSQILANLVGLGIPGLFSILSIYFVPLFIFMRSTKSSSNAKRTAGMMGICLTLGFFIFGLTVETFNIKMLVSFYSLTLAILLAAATHHEKVAA
ncbi:MAG: O-antigen ligase family protein [Gallionella sp.]